MAPRRYVPVTSIPYTPADAAPHANCTAWSRAVARMATAANAPVIRFAPTKPRNILRRLLNI
jgi:hypothetical protein